MSDANGDAPVADRPRRDLLTVVLPALLVYVPLLLTKPGWVGADTKTYLYLDPVKLLEDAPYVWDAQIGLGTVTHQNIGYLFPMGPFYLFFEALGVPDWVAQRLWLGTVMFAAGMGVRYLLRMLGWTERSRRLALLVAVLGYMLSPYLLDYSARISVILLPWAALPWLIALTAKALRHGGWSYPAWFAFVVLLVGGINATALLLIGIGPLLWILHAVWVERQVTFRQAAAAVGRIGALTLATSLWWIAGLWAEGRYGLPVIRYTETYRTVAEVSNAAEVLRGLGYWFFYGNDKLGPWIEPSVEYTTRTALLALSFALPIAAFAAAALTRWRYRAYFIALVVFGALTAIASNPWKTPSVLGLGFKEFTKTNFGLSLRSTPRAVPLVVLGTAVLLAAAIDALGRRVPRAAVPAGVLACTLIVLNLPPLWNGTMVADNLKRPEDVPQVWLDAAAHLQSRDDGTRVLEIPGADFASYRWGNTVDPILPGLMDRPYVARELFTWGSPQSANLLNALDRRLHEDLLEPEALVPVAQLLGVGDINVRSDMQYERYRIARPRTLWDLLARTDGLGTPVGFGPPTANVAGPQQTMIDEVELNTPTGLADPPAVAAIPLRDPRPMTRLVTAERPLLLAGDGDGVVDAAAQGFVNPDQALFYSASFAGEPGRFDEVYGADADLMVTDTNRKRARRWGALRENSGYTERAGEVPIEYDPTDQRLDVFPGAGDGAATVTEQRRAEGAAMGATVTASEYGNPITYTPDDRPVHALDGDPETAWRVGAIGEAIGEELYVSLERPITTDRINVLQPINLERTRWITRLRIVFDDDEASALDVDLTDASRDESAIGQDVTFPTRTFSRLTFHVLDTNLGRRPMFDGVSGVGFAEVRLPGVQVEELVRVPTDLLDRAGPSSLAHRLTLLFTRPRSNPAEPVRTDEEVSMRRIVNLPTDRTFDVSGTARLSAYVEDEVIDALLGLPDATAGGVTARADVRLPGTLRQRASAAIDGDPATRWTSIYQKQVDHWLEYEVADPVTFDHLDLQVVADGQHSVPTRLRIDADGVPAATVDLPAIEDRPPLGPGRPDVENPVPVRVELPVPVTGRTIRITILDVRKVEVQEWYSSGYTVTPVSLAEVGIPGIHLDGPGPTFDSGCRDDLLTVDGRPVPLRVRGTTEDALDRRTLTVGPCGPDAERGVRLAAGERIVRTGIGRNDDIGIDIDRLALTSAAGGGALSPDDLPSEVPSAPAFTVTERDRVDTTLQVDRADKPFWLVLGQSWNPGFTATVNGRPLGAPVPINGYANGWLVDPAVVGTGPLTLTTVWSPQRVVWVFIGISLLAGVACLVLMVRHRRPRDLTVPGDELERPDLPELALPWPWARLTGGERTAPTSRRTATIAALAFGAFVLLDVPTQWMFPLLGVPAALLLAWSLRSPRSRGLLGLAAAGSYLLAAAYIVIQQRRHRYAPNFVWPTLFSRVNILALAAIFLLGAEGLRDVLRREPADAEAEEPS